MSLRTGPIAHDYSLLTACLLPLFVGSGCAALIYEIVWFQSLQLVVGASAISLGVLLTTFMGGMCLGSIAFPAVVPRSWHPLRVYAALELAIGVSAIVLLTLLPAVAEAYVRNFSHDQHQGQFNIMLRAVVAGICLLPPTILMGATLPAIARWFESNQRGAYQTGLFYSANIFGAVMGCLVASFYLLRLYDVVIATYVAVAINVAVSMFAFLCSFLLRYSGDSVLQPEDARGLSSEPTEGEVALSGAGLNSLQVETNSSQVETNGVATGRVAYLAIGLSGTTALGAEVLWTRELSLLLGASVYTFSMILAVFLVALGLGSSLGSAWARRAGQPAVAFAVCQLGAGLGVVWAAWMISSSLPYWPIDVSLSSNPWLTFQLDIVRVAWAVFPAALFWGMSFPIALATAANRQDPARLVAGVYAANTLGAIVGAIGVAWVLIPLAGMQNATLMLVGMLGLSGSLLLVFGLRPSTSSVRRTSLSIKSSLIVRCGLGLSIVGLLILAFWLPAPPRGLIAYGRYMVTWLGSEPEYLYTADGRSASIAVSKFENGVLNFHVSGKVVASSEPQDMRLQRMLGHLPALLSKNPKNVLIVGCGAGVTAGCFVTYPSVERIVICEIEPLIPEAASKYFADYNYDIGNDPRLEIIHDDARHFMLTTDEKFDVITSDPIHPWVKGEAALYSKEYFELSREHLSPGGVATQWVPLYESSEDAVKSEIATFFDVFSDATVWTNDDQSGGYDLILLGSGGELKVDLEGMSNQLRDPSNKRARESLAEVQLGASLALARTFGGNTEQLDKWLVDATINTDRNLHLQYSAGLALNKYSAQDIRQSMESYVRYPKDLFIGTAKQIKALEAAFE